MPEEPLDLRPVSQITADAIGQPGSRVFYIQGRQGDRAVTLVVEKSHIQLLAASVDQFLEELGQKHPGLPAASPEYNPDRMRIHPPVEPLFHVGQMGLGYDAENDLAVIVCKEAVPEGADPKQAREVRFWITRSQLSALCHWGAEVAARGRPICAQCGEPMDPGGHFCPKRNGHKKTGQ